MRTRFALFALLLALASPLHADSDSTSVMTRTGKSYHQCKVIKVSPDGVTFRHSKGIAKVLFVDMNETSQERYGYDPAKVRAYEAKVKEDREKARVAAAEAAAARAKALAEARQRWLETQTLLAVQQSAQMQAVAASQGVGGTSWLVDGSTFFNDGFGSAYGQGEFCNSHGYQHGYGQVWGKDCNQPITRSTTYLSPLTRSIVGSYAYKNGVHVPCINPPAYHGGYRQPANVSLPAHYGALVRPTTPMPTNVIRRSTSFTSSTHVPAAAQRSASVRRYTPRH
jgi:hypothetical protein